MARGECTRSSPTPSLQIGAPRGLPSRPRRRGSGARSSNSDDHAPPVVGLLASAASTLPEVGVEPEAVRHVRSPACSRKASGVLLGPEVEGWPRSSRWRFRDLEPSYPVPP
jgi:hypothetical protein